MDVSLLVKKHATEQTLKAIFVAYQFSNEALHLEPKYLHVESCYPISKRPDIPQNEKHAIYISNVQKIPVISNEIIFSRNGLSIWKQQYF